jgi:hypothetical protein
MLGCSKNGEHSVKADTTTPLVGDILRVRLVDHEGYMVRTRIDCTRTTARAV